MDWTSARTDSAELGMWGLVNQLNMLRYQLMHYDLQAAYSAVHASVKLQGASQDLCAVALDTFACVGLVWL